MSIELIQRIRSHSWRSLFVAVVSLLSGCGSAREPTGSIPQVPRSASASSHASVTFTTVDVPGALATIASDITAMGDVVGRYCVQQCQDITGDWHGFLLSEGEFTSIDFPGAFHTNATGLNPRDDIVG